MKLLIKNKTKKADQELDNLMEEKIDKLQIEIKKMHPHIVGIEFPLLSRR